MKTSRLGKFLFAKKTKSSLTMTPPKLHHGKNTNLVLETAETRLQIPLASPHLTETSFVSNGGVTTS